MAMPSTTTTGTCTSRGGATAGGRSASRSVIPSRAADGSGGRTWSTRGGRTRSRRAGGSSTPSLAAGSSRTSAARRRCARSHRRPTTPPTPPTGRAGPPPAACACRGTRSRGAASATGACARRAGGRTATRASAPWIFWISGIRPRRRRRTRGGLSRLSTRHVSSTPPRGYPMGASTCSEAESATTRGSDPRPPRRRTTRRRTSGGTRGICPLARARARAWTRTTSCTC
mmetsp:Transcript_9333/g.33983  ORF Transcript_9333/g.33983 Transcript_9333/m.33983 type:complete len:229 (+) Transcript_9333:897-1583(+)